MQIVIDISDIDYGCICNMEDKYTNYAITIRLYEAIKKGTPLPKGHGRLIEVTNQLEQELFTFTRYTGIDECPYESATLITDNAPTIIEADRSESE